MPSVKIRIRDARKEDLKAVVGLWEKLAEQHARLSSELRLAPDGKRKWARYLAKKFSEKSTKLIVAEEDGDIVGFMLCLLTPNTPIYKDKTIGVISDVYVNEKRRKKGVAGMMLKLALRWFAKNRASSVQLGTAYANLEARAIWNQLGFRPFYMYKRLRLDEPSH